MAHSQLVIFSVIFLSLFVFVFSLELFNKDGSPMKVQSKEGETLYDGDKANKTEKHPKMQEYSKQAHLRPTKCQVCRVLVQEIVIELNKTNNARQSMWLTNRLDGEEESDELRGKKIDYKKSEMRLDDVLETVCQNVYNYRSVPGPAFPYLKGVKSTLRKQLEGLIGDSKLHLKLDAPEELVEDPTLELRRMLYACNQMVEEHEDDIVEWYLKKQDADPIDFICAERIIDEKDNDCLHASTTTPTWAEEPAKLKKNEKLKDFTKAPRSDL